MNSALRIAATVSLAITAFLSCKNPSEKNEAQSLPENGSVKMAAILKTIADTANPANNYFLNSQHVEQIRQQMQNGNPQHRFSLQGTLAYELLQAGKTIEAIAELESFIRTADSLNIPLDMKFYNLLSIAYMRMGEQQNCCERHTAESCIIPIKGSGLHSMREGSEKAISLYTKILDKNPGDLQSRWVLNLAYMTIGKYPREVPKEYFVPLKDSPGFQNYTHFTDAAPDAGLDDLGLLGGSCMEDFNNDGLLDIMCTSQGLRDQVKLFINTGDGKFKDATSEAGLTGIVSGCNMAHADYNNDGWNDVFIMRGGWLRAGGNHPNSLLKNNGDGTFEDVTIEAGLLSFHPCQAASWADFNNDGYLDLYVGNESSDGLIHPCEFYMNDKNGTFTNIAGKLKMDIVAFVKAVAWGDINNDGLPDLYCSGIGMKKKLFLNKGGTSVDDWKFEDISERAGVEKPYDSFTCWFFDYNNDGWEDIFVSGYTLSRLSLVGYDAANEYLGNKPLADVPHIYRNNKNNTFTDVTNETGFEKRVCYSMGANYGDLDNDGWTDFYLGTGSPDYRSLVPNRMFHNDVGKFFSEVTYSGGFGHIQKGHGVAWGDIDNDGDQDIYIKIGGAVEGDVFQSALFENPGSGNNWITLKLEGTTGNRSAIGARIKISVTDADDSQRTIYVTCSTGGSFGCSSLQQEIGLGRAKKIDSVEIIFPDGKNITKVYKNVEMNKFYRVVQGKEKLEVTPKKSYKSS